MTPQKYVETINVEYSAVFAPHYRSRNADEKNLSLNWTITLHNKHGQITFDYAQGIGHLPGFEHGNRTAYYNDMLRIAANKGEWKHRKVKKPELVNVLYSIVMDSSVLKYACFDDWASEFGYDTDGRKAAEIYNDCLKIALKARQMFNLNELNEVFQDY